MPVKSEATMSLIDYLTIDPVSEPLLPDDIWNKFEIEYTGMDDIFIKEAALPPPPQVKLENACPRPKIKREILRNHDCMWGGHCFSEEHPASDDSHPYCFFPMDLMRPSSVMLNLEPAQQSLLKPAVRAANAAMPQTPPMSDDEECKRSSIAATSVLRLLNDAIEDCDLDEDSDLCDYFEDKGDGDVDVNVTDDHPVIDDEEEEEEEQMKSNIIRYQFATENDHSYHKGKTASAMMLGIDTPSDSEEEIDVVSVVDKKQYNNNNNNNGNIINTNIPRVLSLPTNPSNRDRHHIQRRMATAISKKKTANSIKTILPIRKPATGANSSDKRKPASGECRGVKRSKPFRSAGPSKRRHHGHSSDSDQEPSEKRSLHNNMERQRRIDLRNAFEDLRVLVPEVSKKERAAKVVILREAAQYCDLLSDTSVNYAKHSDDLKRRQEWLRQRVSQLRRNLAAKR